MQNFFFHQKISAFWVTFTLATALAILAGCGSGTANTGGTGGTASAAAVPSLTIELTQNGVTTNSIPSGATVTAAATFKNASGIAVTNSVVTFTSSDATLSTMTPINGTALTNASGIATITLTAGASTGGAATLTASAQLTTVVAGVSTTVPVTGTVGYSVGQGATLTVSAPTFGIGGAPNTLSAYGTTSISVTVASGGVPVTSPQLVTFASTCAVNGKAVVSPPVYTLNGVATASYRDNGCAGSDLITVSVAGIISAPSLLTVTPPSSGSIQFVSATPPYINLKGTGGKETSVVVFKVMDVGGNPISGKTVTFNVDINATAGGVTLTPTPSIAISDSNGLVQTIVNSGPVSTPVRIAASTPGTGSTILNSTSNALTITTGIPDQDSFSLAASTFNIEGWDIAGVQTVLTARLSDHFNNPVPENTPVNFITEGGSIIGSCSTGADTTLTTSSSTTGSTTKGNGWCTTTLTSGAPRPQSTRNGWGRATVLAYAVGEESFTDYNGNGWADVRPIFSPLFIPSEMIDANGNSTDLGEAWVDYNENGSFEQNGEPFIDFNNNLETPTTYVPGVYDSPDGFYSGVLCDNVNLKDPSNPAAGTRSAPNSCAASRTIHVRRSTVIVFSTSRAIITITPAQYTFASAINPTIPALTVQIPVTAADNGKYAWNETTNSFWQVVAGVWTGPVARPTSIALPPCNPDLIGPPPPFGNSPLPVIVTVVDENGNAMPAGTKVDFSIANNGQITSDKLYTVPNTNSCRTSNPAGITGAITPFPGCDGLSALASETPGFGDIPVSLMTDASYTAAILAPPTPAVCSDTTHSGTFTVKVTSPSGVITTATMPVTD